jgi:hypothetical protein
LFSEERAPPISHFEQPSCFRLVINKKVLETLGLTIPPAILMRADEVVALQAERIEAFLKLKTGMWRRTRERLQARHRSLRAKAPAQQRHKSRRLDAKAMLSQTNCSTRGAMHWR